jgi:hypothetical protein
MATSSGSRAHLPRRKTIGRGISSGCGRRPASSSTYQATADVDRLQQTARRDAAVRLRRTGRRPPTICRGARQTNRWWMPSPGVPHRISDGIIMPPARRARRAGGNGRRRSGQVHRGGVSGQAGADPPLQPDGQGPAGATSQQP